MPLAEAQHLEATLFGLVAATDDMREGTRAFLEKRKAEWKGRVMATFEGRGAAPGLRFAIVVSRWNDFVTDAAAGRGPTRPCARPACPPTAVDVVWVPGAFELAGAARRVAERIRPAAVVCLGCVIRGGTPHFEYIASAAAHGISQASAETGVPMAFGVLTTDSVEQAVRTRRGGAGQQGPRGGAGRHRDGHAVPGARGRAVTGDRRARPMGRPASRPRSGAAGALPDDRRPPRPGYRRVAGPDAWRRGCDRRSTIRTRRSPGGWRSAPGRRGRRSTQIIEPLCTNWRLDRLNVVDHLVLRLAIHEWLTEPSTPPRVVLSEALDLARDYSGEAAVRFVNGVLDAAFRQLRADGRIIE